MSGASLGWVGIVRLGLVQMALGAIVVLTTSTLNRVMVVELALPEALPGALVAWHYVLQVLRPRLGYGSDVTGRRTPWIVGGVGVLAVGGLGAAIATALMATHPAAGVVLAIAAFTLIGLGVGAAGTSLLALLARQVDPRRRAAAATIVWLMMIAGIIVTAITAGALLDPFSPGRLIAVSATVSAAAFLLTLLAVWNVEGSTTAVEPATSLAPKQPFREALAEVWGDAAARRFAIFVFVSMLAYSSQDLILEPFAGLVFGMTPGQSTQLTGTQHAGVFMGMALVGIAGSKFSSSVIDAVRAWSLHICLSLVIAFLGGSALGIEAGVLLGVVALFLAKSMIGGRQLGSMRAWTIAGCIGSAAALLGLAAAGLVGPAWPLSASVFALGFANGAFAVAAIGSMMGLAGAGQPAREGTRMGLWGAAQALAFGLGGFLGTVGVDLARALLATPAAAYAAVFACEAILFLAAAALAAQVGRRPAARVTHHAHANGGFAASLSGR